MTFLRILSLTFVLLLSATALAQEKDDHVIIDRGLKAGETVVSVGALILAQIYEDARALELIARFAE